MSKLYRSLLWSGLVVAGVAACGDDVTVAPPPPPPIPTVLSVTVAPNPGQITPGGTLQMVASVNADAGVATTVTWSSSNSAVVSVSATGLATAVASATPGTSVAITACATAATGVCNSATVNVIAATTPSVTSVTVTPATAGIVVGQTIQATAAVQGANNPDQTAIAWTSLSPGIATVSATGLITGVANGTAVIRACSTIPGFTNVCGSADITVTTPSPASVNVSSVTWVTPAPVPANPPCTAGAGGVVPVPLTNVSCQIEITVQVNSGDQQLERVDVLIGDSVMASQSFGTTPTELEAAPTQSIITLSTNTRQLAKVGSLFVPVLRNGNREIRAELFVVGSSTPIASNAVPVVMNNLDVVAVPELVATATSPSVVVGGNTWFKGTQTVTASYIAYSNTMPTAFTFAGSSICPTTPAAVIAGSPTAGISLTGVFTCANVEGPNALAALPAIALAFGTAVTGPDGTQLPNIGNLFFVGVGSAFTLDGQQRFNPIPLPAVGGFLVNPIGFIDNRGPTVDIGGSLTFPVTGAPINRIVAFNSAFDQWWINDAFAFLNCVPLATCVTSGRLLAQDLGVGLAAGFPIARITTSALLGTPGVLTDFCNGQTVATGADLANTVTSLADGYRACTYAEDLLQNPSVTTLTVTSAAAASNGQNKSNRFGKDNVAPAVRLAGSVPAVAPTFASMAITFPAVSPLPNVTIFGPFAPFAVTDRLGVEALDNAAGFNQNVVAGFPAVQTMLLHNPATNPAANILSATCGFTNALGVSLSDTWVRTSQIPAAALLDCTTGFPGYFTYTGAVVDRAGNGSASVTLNYAIDQYFAPNITGIGFQGTLYTGGQPAFFTVSANDDLEIIDGSAFLVYPNVQIGDGAAFVNAKVGYGFGGLPPLGIRWDATLTNVLNGAPLTIPYFVRRIEQVCEGAGVPFGTCAAAGDPFDNTLPGGPTAQQTAAVADVNQVTANVADVASTASAFGQTQPILASQLATAGAAAPFAVTAVPNITCTTAFGPPPLPATCTIRNWSLQNIGGNLVATHTASTSVVSPYFDLPGVQLYELVFTGAEYQWTFRGYFPAPVSTDNGFARFWTYTLPHPTNSPGSTGFYRAMGLKGGSGLMTNRAL